MSALVSDDIFKLSNQVIGNGESHLICSNQKGNIRYANASACFRLGFTLDQLLGKTVADYSPLQTPNIYNGHFQRCLRNGNDRVYGYHQDCEGEVYPVEIYSVPHLVERTDEQIICSIVQEAQYSKRYQRMLGTVEESQRIGSFDYNLLDQSIIASDNLLHIMGAENAESLRPASVVDRLSRQDTGRWNAQMLGFVGGGHHRMDEEFQMRAADDRIVTMRVVMWSTIEDGQVNGITGYYEVLDTDRSEVLISLDESQRRHIIRALNYTGGRVTGERGAGKLLGINGKTLFARMKKLNINRSDYVRKK